MGKIIIVSNRLPVRVQKKERQLFYKSSEGGLATGLGSIYSQEQDLWIGWPGMYTNSPTEQKFIKKELKKKNLYPVFLQKQDIRDYYDGFSNEIIWPLFHYFPQYAKYNSQWWESYKRVNELFCQEIVNKVKKDDLIWIHDYHLFLLPAMLRKLLPDNPIGFFLHIPFPSFEIFRLCPWRKEIVEGMMGADLVGFHTYDYLQHFIHTASRITNVKNNGNQLEFDGRTVFSDVFPIGIDYKKFEHLSESKKVEKHVKKLREEFGQRKIILSIDRLDYSKGIVEKLKAFEEFLEHHPEYHNKVTLVQILVPSRDKVEEYQLLKEEINRLVGSINSNYRTISWNPVYDFYRSFPIEMLSAFYQMADIALVTPMRDGMNLVCKEFLASKKDKKGVLILSEMAGASIELSEAILINPNHKSAYVNALLTALTMNEDEQMRRIEIMQDTLKRFNIHHWAHLFTERLIFSKQKQDEYSTREFKGKPEIECCQEFSRTSRRLILLDYDGTLVPFNLRPDLAIPDQKLISLLKKLGNLPNTDVVIISGRNKESLDKWFSRIPVHLVAEHGGWIKKNQEEWIQPEIINTEWKKDVAPVLQYFADRTPGAFVEEKSFSIVWHFRKVEKGLGELRSRELIDHLQYLLGNYNLHVLEGDMVVEVKNSAINKGKSVLHWIGLINPDFIMCIGDDWTDEEMFRVLPLNSFSIKVRGGVSSAKYSLGNHLMVRKFLSQLSRIKPEETLNTGKSVSIKNQ